MRKNVLVLKTKDDSGKDETPQAPPSLSTPPVVSLTDSHAARERAEQSLAQVDRRLAMTEAARLGPDEMQTYDQAISIRSRAQTAIQAHDYAAAQALGDKAERLTATLKPR